MELHSAANTEYRSYPLSRRRLLDLVWFRGIVGLVQYFIVALELFMSDKGAGFVGRGDLCTVSV